MSDFAPSINLKQKPRQIWERRKNNSMAVRRCCDAVKNVRFFDAPQADRPSLAPRRWR
jgi:hypothetical protein